MGSWKGVLREFWDYMPNNYTEDTPVVTLREGNTPLIHAPELAKALNFRGNLFLKNEGANAGTNSFKDRGMTSVVSKAIEEGSEAIICASTGNTAAAAACYAAAARNMGYKLQCVVLLPEGKVAQGKLVQAAMLDATIIQIKGSYDDALGIVRELEEGSYPVTVVNSINPHRFDGQKTAALEIVGELGEAPDYHFIPVGNAANIVTYWQGYNEHKNTGRLPHMMGWQAAAAAPIVDGQIFKHPNTFASAINIGNPSRWNDALQVVSESDGTIGKVSDYEINVAHNLIPRLTGVFCEPASAAPVAGLMKAVEEGLIKKNRKNTTVVCTLTGNGLKDPSSAVRKMEDPVVAEANTEAIAQYLT